MARDHGRVRWSIWSDPDWCALREVEQRLFLLLLSQPGLSYAGVVPFTARRWQSLAADTTPIKLRKAVNALASARFIVTDPDTEELLIRSHLRNDGLLDSPNICRAVVRDFDAVCSPLLRAVIVCEAVRLQSETPRPGNDRSWDEVLSPWLTETLPQTFGGTFPQTLTPAQHRTLESVENQTLALTLASARAAPAPTPSLTPRLGARPRPERYCEVHRLDEPCRGCAADRKVAAS